MTSISHRVENQLSYRRFAEVLHDVLSEQSLGPLLDRIADALSDLVPHDYLHIYETDYARGLLIPRLARDPLAEAVLLASPPKIGTGITGWAVEHRVPVLANDAMSDPRVDSVPGTPNEDEALISVPLIARGAVKGALNVYRAFGVAFTSEEFETVQLFADAAAVALDNAQIKASLEHEAQTDSLTGLYNHRHFHERLRAELHRAGRTGDSVAVVMFDIDDFKRVNDLHGHSLGDRVLATIAETMRSTIRQSDIACRVGGEEFAIIMPSADAGDALLLARRLSEQLGRAELDPVGRITLSVGISQGPEHGMNPRGLVACAEAAMMTAKARGKNRVVLYEEEDTERPDGASPMRDVRSLAHMKLLQSIAGQLNRLNDVEQIGLTIADELRTLMDYYDCWVSLVEGDTLVPVAFRADAASDIPDREALSVTVGEGITGRVAATGEPLLIHNSLECEFAAWVPGTAEVEESVLVVPLSYGARVIGIIAVSKLGVGGFDEDDLRLLEVLAGQASVALENARLYDVQRREAASARALLAFADELADVTAVRTIEKRTVRATARLLDASQVSLWMQVEPGGEFQCRSHTGYATDPTARSIVRSPVDLATGTRFIGGRKGAFEVPAAEVRSHFTLPEDAVVRTIAVCPVHSDDELAGWLVVREPPGREHFFTDERLRLLEGIGSQSAQAMQKARLYRSQAESAEIANALLEFSRELSAADHLDDVLCRAAELAGRLLGSECTSVWLQDPQTGEVVPEALWGYDAEERELLKGFRLPPPAALLVLNRSEPFTLYPEERRHLGSRLPNQTNLTMAVAPLHLEGGRIGAIVALAPTPGEYEFSERKMHLLAGIADQTKLAVASSSSYESLERTFVSTVEALANALEAKDEYTSSHTRWIADMAVQVGGALGLDQPQLKNLELGAVFHDIGKIGIPSRILSKPGPLTSDEWGVIRTHPELGEKILAPIEWLRSVRPIVRACHEHYDGSGYPDGKSKTEIPMEARIILVCDAFHAMATDRPYRRGSPVAEVVPRLRAAAGSQLDPAVVDAFLIVLSERPELGIVSNASIPA